MPDPRFYKFSTINKNLIDSLVKGYLFCAKPEKLNDPFDCRLDINKSINKAIESLSGDSRDKLQALIENSAVFTSMEEDIGKFGVCSFSKEMKLDKESLMWSHYADNHRGACVLYEIPEEFLMDKTNNIIGVDKVNYDENPLIDWFVNFANDSSEVTEEFIIDILKKALTSKNMCWDYEKELRIIRKEAGKIEIPKSYIKQICFGLHASDEDISLITEIIKGYEHEINLCKVIRTESDFGIDYEEI